MTSNTEKSPLTSQDLARFTGDLERYKHPFNRRIIYTPGVQFMAKKAGAYWLIDAIASYFGSPQMNRAMKRDERLASLQFWRLDVKPDHTAQLTARADAGVKPFITQEISFTDFPLPSVDIWAGASGEGHPWTLYLPSEH